MYIFIMANIETKDLLPQKEPFKMIDFLLFVDEYQTKTNFTIRDENMLVSDSYFTEGGLIENMAQSAAAGSGYYFSLQKKEIPMGYIGAVKNVEVLYLPKIGDTIETVLIQKNKIGNAAIVDGKIFLDNELIASCELTIFTP